MPKVPFFKDSGCCPKILDYTLNDAKGGWEDTSLPTLCVKCNFP